MRKVFEISNHALGREGFVGICDGTNTARGDLSGDCVLPDEATIRIGVHRQNIRRYKFLLETPLTDLEHAFIKRRIAEEQAEVRRLTAHRSKMSAGARGTDAPLYPVMRADDRISG